MPADEPPGLLRTGEAARRLGLSRRTLQRYARAGWITPELELANGEYRWDLMKLREQIRELARRQREASE